MSDQERSTKPEKVTTIVLGLICAVLAAVLWMPLVIYGPEIGSRWQDVPNEGIKVVFWMWVSFALFFTIIAIGALRTLVAKRKELFTVHGWRVIAVLFFIVATTGWIDSIWAAALLPATMGGFCLAKDPGVWKKLAFLLTRHRVP